MNFERISFRTNEQERLILSRLNQRYKCKTVTSFMHKLLREVIEKGFLEGKYTKNVMGDSRGLTLDEKDPEVQRLTQEVDRLIPMMPEFDEPEPLGARTVPKPAEAQETQPRYDALERFMKDLADMERLKNAVYRTLPSR